MKAWQAGGGEVRRIMGVDPGSMVTGFGVIDSDGHHLRHVVHGHIRSAGDGFEQRIADIHRQLSKVFAQYRPHEFALEDAFVGTCARSALKLGQARGAIVIAGASIGLVPASYSPATVKKRVTGSGQASKEAVQAMVRMLLGIEEKLQADAGDGLGIAICHAQQRRMPAALKAAPRGRRRGGRGLRL